LRVVNVREKSVLFCAHAAIITARNTAAGSSFASACARHAEEAERLNANPRIPAGHHRRSNLIRKSILSILC
jgi:hypothetical protein